MSNRLRRLAVLATLVVMTMWGPSLVRSDVVATAAAKLSDLRGVDELKTLFNQDKGRVRLVLLVSPT
jgi:hypothetical protein